MATKTASGVKDSGIDTKLIRDLAEILNDTNLSDIEIEREEIRIRVSRSVEPQLIQATSIPPIMANAPAVSAPSAPAAAVPDAAADVDQKNIITSPMVGTAYLAPAPGAEPFVKIGQQVKEGQPLLIVEAMKTMNQLPSPRAGTVKAILVSDAQPVEFGEPLIIVE